MKFINIPVFLLSFAVGLFFVYISSAPNKSVVVFPTPENQSQVQYKDNSDTCHSYKAVETNCPTDNSAIDYTIQS